MSYRRSANTSKFSNYLKGLFERSGESVASVARSIGAERTSIHKALSGERMLPYHVAHALADHFQLSLEEQQEYFRLYDILLQGENVWQNRSAVASLLNYLSTIPFQATTARTTAAAVPPPICENTPIKGEFAVTDAVNSILYYEIQQNDHPTFQLFLPPDMDLSQLFISQWLNGNQFDVEQLFCISTISSDNCAKNIQLLRQIIPMSLISRESYLPFHFHETAGSAFINPLNYYIITPHYLILFKQDQTIAYVHQNELIHIYTEHFRSLTEHCELLVFRAANLSEVLHRSNSIIDFKGNLYMLSQPCFGHYYSPKIIRKYFQVQNCPVPGIFEEAVKHFALLHEIEKNFYTVFTEKGLQYFIETGIVTEMPKEYIPAADVEDRLYLLTRLRDDTVAGRVTGLIARPSSLRIPEYLTITINSNGDAYFDTTSDFPLGACYCNIHISEKSICQAFKDFFTSLSGSQLVYSQEETLRMLDEGIRKLSEKISPQG